MRILRTGPNTGAKGILVGAIKESLTRVKEAAQGEFWGKAPLRKVRKERRREMGEAFAAETRGKQGQRGRRQASCTRKHRGIFERDVDCEG